MPAQYIWIDATADGMFGTAGNWSFPDIIPPLPAIPGPTGDAFFGGPTGAITPCTVNGSFAVHSVVMHNAGPDAYNSIFFVPAGSSVAASVQFDQFGTLLLDGTVSCLNNIYIEGAIVASAGSALTANGTVLVTAPAAFSGSVLLTGGSVMISGGLTTVAAATFLAINASALTVMPDSTIALGTFSIMSFTGITPADLFDVKGTITMSTATITSNATMNIDGGTLTCLGAETIIGDVGSTNGGTINVGPFGAATLTMATGALTLGALQPALPSTGATLNLFPGSIFTCAPGIPLTVKGDVNMFGAGITGDVYISGGLPGSTTPPPYGVVNSLAVGAMDTIFGNVTCNGTLNVGIGPGQASFLMVMGTPGNSLNVGGTMNINEASSLMSFNPVSVAGSLNMYGGSLAAMLGVSISGTLTSYGGSAGQGDVIGTIFFTNNGTVKLTGLTLHTLGISGNYTQGNSGILWMRISDTSNDWLNIGGTATLAGTLTVNSAGSLPAGLTWTILTANGGITPNTDFGSLNLPPGINNGFPDPLNPNNYIVF